MPHAYKQELGMEIGYKAYPPHEKKGRKYRLVIMGETRRALPRKMLFDSQLLSIALSCEIAAHCPRCPQRVPYHDRTIIRELRQVYEGMGLFFS